MGWQPSRWLKSLKGMAHAPFNARTLLVQGNSILLNANNMLVGEHINTHTGVADVWKSQRYSLCISSGDDDQLEEGVAAALTRVSHHIPSRVSIACLFWKGSAHKNGTSARRREPLIG